MLKKLLYSSFHFLTLRYILISILYNSIYLFIFFYYFISYPGNPIVLTIIFLLSYIIIAQPLKDFIFFSLLMKPANNISDQFAPIDQKIPSLYNKMDLIQYMNNLNRELNCSEIFLLSSDPEQKAIISYINNTYLEKNMKSSHMGEICNAIQFSVTPIQWIDFPPIVQTILKNYNWQVIIPLFFRDHLSGFLAFSCLVNKKNIAAIQKVSYRFALLLENEVLLSKAMKNRFFIKEFRTARKIESLLITDTRIVIKDRIINYINNFDGVTRYYPLLYEKSFNKENSKVVYFILSKISSTMARKKSILLFDLQGYFLVHSKNANSLQSLAQMLNKSICFSSLKYFIEGYLFEINQNGNFSYISFGKNLSIEADMKHHLIPENLYLGQHKNSIFKKTSIKYNNDIIIKIENNSFIQISRLK